jgi:hypothetical protein
MRNSSTISLFITLFILLAGCSPGHDHHNDGHHGDGHHYDDTTHHEHAEDDSKKKSNNIHQDISDQSL